MSFDDAARAFREWFPDGGLTRLDFRPHFDGHAINAYVQVWPLRDERETRAAAAAVLAEMTGWLRAHAGVFGPGDRLQLVVGFPDTVKRDVRQIFKCWVPATGLATLDGVNFASVGGGYHEMEFWAVGVPWAGA